MLKMLEQCNILSIVAPAILLVVSKILALCSKILFFVRNSYEKCYSYDGNDGGNARTPVEEWTKTSC